jgi:protein ImuA
LSDKQDLLRQLQEELLPLQGFRPPTAGARVELGLGPVKACFPKGQFPTGAVHELLSGSDEEGAATCGFVTALLAPLMRQGGACLWISSRTNVFPPALKRFGTEPEKIVFVHLAREKDAIWAMEEALKCEGLAAVVGEIRNLDFTASRKLQLAVEKSRVTGFLLRDQPGSLGTVAAVARWKVSPLATDPGDEMPGVGFPRWKIELLKVRNGRPGTFVAEWAHGALQWEQAEAVMIQESRRKTG